MNLRAEYDCIIVGAGISGLAMSLMLRERYPTWSIAILERYKGLGGRTYSYHPTEFPGVQWEMGAGRIHKDHHLVMNLVHKYKLHWQPISSDISYKNSGDSPLEPVNPFETAIVPTWLAPLQTLDSRILQKMTLEEICKKVYGPEKTQGIFGPFPYRSEVNTLRADMSLDGFLKGEMKSHHGYGVLKEGFSELIARMTDECIDKGITILRRHRVLEIIPLKDSMQSDIQVAFGYKEKGKPHGVIKLRAKRAVVLAIHALALKEIPRLRHSPVLRHLEIRPLLRIYMIFPTPAWFGDLPRVVSPHLPRYILPINPEKGVVMISYTDGTDAKPYMDIYYGRGGEEALKRAVMSDVRRLFPERSIPEPLFIKAHAWDLGASYWKPGSYDPESISRSTVQPLPNQFPGVWLCGESWSTRQAWVEGALEHTDICFQHLIKNV